MSSINTHYSRYFSLVIMVVILNTSTRPAHAGDDWETLLQSLKLRKELQPGWDKWERCEKEAQEKSVRCWQAVNAASEDHSRWLAGKRECRDRELEERAACQSEWEKFKKAIQSKKDTSITKKRTRDDDSWIKERKEEPDGYKNENIPARPLKKMKKEW